MTSTALVMLIYLLWEVLTMNDYDREAIEAKEDYDAEQYDVEKDKAMLEADELAAIVRKQFIQEGLC